MYSTNEASSNNPLAEQIGNEIQPFAAKNHSILVVDDDEDQLRYFEDLLQEAGYRVFTVPSAEDALELMSKIYIDLVVSDLRMPNVTGFEFIQKVRAIRTLPRTEHIPVIMLTGCSADLEAAALAVGADLFCEKKLARKKLAKQIQWLLSQNLKETTPSAK